MKNPSILFLALSLVVYSCGSSSSKEEKIVSNYELQIVDSVQVDLLSSGISVMDVHDKTGEILAIQSDPPIAYVLSPTGEVLKKMERPGDDPQAVGPYILSGEFYEDGIALMGMMRVSIYDSAFNLIESTKPKYTQSGMIYMGFNHLMEIQGKDHNRLLAFFGGPQTELRSQVPEYYEEYNVADVLDPYLVSKNYIAKDNLDQEVYRPIGKLTNDSRYRTSGKAFYFMKPVMDVKNNFLYYAFKDDTTLYKLSLPNGEIVDETRIPFDDFILFEGYTMGMAGIKEQRDPRDWSGGIDNVFSVDGFQVIVYTSGMKLSKVEELDPKSPDFRTRTDKINYKKYLVLKDGERMNANLRLPEKVSHFSMADNEGFIWAHQDISNLEEEPDLITFYKLKVVGLD